MVGWAYVWERLWAMNLHAVMGALIGLGLYGYFALGSRRQLAGFFVLAMLYHHFVDGMIITAGFVPSLANIMNSLGSVVVILDLALGLVFLALVYRSQRVSGAAAKPPDANVTVVDSA